jgi:hypothetical protein
LILGFRRGRATFLAHIGRVLLKKHRAGPVLIDLFLQQKKVADYNAFEFFSATVFTLLFYLLVRP